MKGREDLRSVSLFLLAIRSRQGFGKFRVGTVVGRVLPCSFLDVGGDVYALFAVLRGLVFLAVEGPECHVVRRRVQQMVVSTDPSPAATQA